MNIIFNIVRDQPNLTLSLLGDTRKSTTRAVQRERDTVAIVRLMVTEPSVEIVFPPLDFMIYSHKTALFSLFVASMGFPIII